MIKEIIYSFLCVLTLFVSLFFIPEIRNKKKYWISLSLISILMLCLGINKIKNDNADKKEYAENTKRNQIIMNDLKKNVQDLTKINEQNLIFQKRLRDKFSIEKDTNNEPKVINYTTNINTAGTVNIGSVK